MDPVLLVVVLGAALAGVGAGVAVARRRLPAAGSQALDRRLAGISEDLDRRLAGLDQRLGLGLDGVQRAQDQAVGVAADVRERVAQIGGVAEQVLEHARGLGRLEDLLRPPQARGAFGEVQLEQLLAQGLPDGCYRMQHAFRSGVRADAVLLLGEGLVAVDAKFPLEAFERLASSPEGGDPGRVLHRKAFLRDVRRHIDAIADKYICPEEGTFDFALCYVPSEAVYYEFLREDGGGSAFRQATARRVFPVSPTTLYAYLVSIGLGLRGLRVEADARRIIDALTGLAGELERFRDDFEVVGKHLGNARARWDEAARRLDRFDSRLAEVGRSSGVAARPVGEVTAPAPAPPAVTEAG